MTVQLIPNRGGWDVRLKFGSAPARTVRFADWARGGIVHDLGAAPAELRLGGEAVIRPGSATWSINNAFEITLASPPGTPGIQFATGRAAGIARKVALKPKPVLSQPAADAGGPGARPGQHAVLTEVSFQPLADSGIVRSRRTHLVTWYLSDDAREENAGFRRLRELRDRAVPLGGVGGLWMALEPADPTVTVETYVRANGREGGILRIEGGSSGGPASGHLIVTGAGFRRGVVRLKLNAPVMTAILSEAANLSTLRVMLAEGEQGIPADQFAVSVRPGEPAIWRFDVRSRPGRVVARVGLAGLSLSVAAADRCDVAFVDTAADLFLGEERSTDAPVSSGPIPDCDAVIRLGGRNRVHAAMEKGVIRLRRSRDLFDLGFGLRGYGIDVDGAEARLVRETGRACDVGDPPPLLIAHFGPQHVQEESFDLQRSTPATPTLWARARALVGSPTPATPQARSISEPAPYARIGPQTFQTHLARTRSSGPSRLVFGLNDPSGPPQDLPIAIDALTDWDGRALVVHRRAIPDTVSLEDQILVVAGISRTMSRAQARVRIEEGLKVPPSPTETALEMVTGVILSTDSRARFLTPRGAPEARPVPLWKAELDPDTRTSTRAIWAPGTSLALEAPIQTSAPFEIVPSRSQAREWVLQSSAFGIPAMRALSVAGRDVPASLVRRPAGSFAYLPDDDQVDLPGSPSVKVHREGVIGPVPLAIFEAGLTAIGGTARMEFRSEPARPVTLRGERFFNPAFQVEAVLLDVQYGRTVLGKVETKGYLFPHGFRATYVEVVQRRVLPFQGGKIDPYFYLVLRRYIKVGEAEKVLPTLYEPFDGRDFPASRMAPIPVETPDLIDKERLEFASGATEEEFAFWPRTELGTTPSPDPRIQRAAYGSEVAFRYRADGPGAPVRVAPMAFVSNAAIGNVGIVKGLVAYYEGLGSDPGLRRLTRDDHGDADTTFAATAKPGDTTFKTRSVWLGARGRVFQTDAGEVEDYDIDPFMEGADQPPFYPRMKSADIEIQSLDRLMGRAHGLVEVGYDEVYVRHGFDKVRNPSELYLRVQTPGIDLDLSGQGATSGGVVKPNSRLAGLSRSSGLVGGRAARSTAQPVTALASASSVSAGVPAPIYDLSAATKGEFSVVEFLGGSLKGPSILGIPLIPLIATQAFAAAPRLKESFSFASHALDGLASGLRTTAAAVRAEIAAARTQGTAALRRALPGADIELSDLYPDLMARIAAVDAILAACEALPDDAGLEAALPLATGLAQAGKPLLAAIKAILDNPTPAFVEEVLVDIQAARNLLKDPIGRLEASLVQALGTSLDVGRDSLLDALFEAIVDAGLAEALFGPLDYESDALRPNRSAGLAPEAAAAAGQLRQRQLAACRAMLKDPEAALSRAGDSIFQAQFAAPLIGALGAFTRLADAGARTLEWSRRAMVTQVGATFSGLAATVGDGDLRASALTAGAQAVVAAIEAALSVPLGADPVGDIATRMATLDRAIAPVLALMAGPAASPLGVAIPESVAGEIGALRSRLDLVEKRLSELKAEAIQVLAEETRAELRAEANQLFAEWQQVDATAKALARLVVILPSAASRIRDDIAFALKADVDRAVERLKVQAAGAADDVVRRVTRTAEQMLLGALATTTLAIDSAIGSALPGYCRPGAGEPSAVVIARALVLGTIAGTGTLKADLDLLVAKLEALSVPDQTSTALQSYREVVAGLRSAAQSVGQVIVEIERVRTALSPDCKPTGDGYCMPVFDCGRPGVLLAAVGKAYALRQEAAARLRNLVGQLAVARTKVPPGMTMDAQIREVQLTLRALMLDVTSIAFVTPGDAGWTDFETLVSAFSKAVAASQLAGSAALQLRVDDAIAGLKAEALAIKALSHASAEDMSALAERVAAFTAGHEKALASALLSAVALPQDVAGKATALASGSLLKLLPVLEAIHAAALEPLDKVLDVLRNHGAGEGVNDLLLMLGAPALKRVQTARDAVESDRLAIVSVVAALKDPNAPFPAADVGALVVRWRNGEAGLAMAIRMVTDMATSIASGQITDIIPMHALETALREAVSDLLPTRVALDYAWETPLREYPAGDPIFEMDRAASRSAFKDHPQADLVLSTAIEVDLLTQKRSFSTKGEVRPFKLRLLGSSFDLLTLSFARATFTLDRNGKSTFDAPLSTVEFGTMLEFIKPLAAILGGNGIYALPVFNPPGVEVGFRLAKDRIDVGTLSFLNIAVGASVFLPFQDQQAEFRFHFASRELPFLIVSPPYGGGGFVSLTASASGIMAFAVQLEMGFVGDIAFGPLKGHARATAGFYLESHADGGRELEGFVQAIGQGVIVCFGISVNIHVSVRQVNGGAMTGASRYKFTFSVGMFDVSYSFTASYAFQGGGGGGGGGGAKTVREQRFHLDQAGNAAFLALPDPDDGAGVRVVAPIKTRDWAGYRAYFASEW